MPNLCTPSLASHRPFRECAWESATRERRGRGLEGSHVVWSPLEEKSESVPPRSTGTAELDPRQLSPFPTTTTRGPPASTRFTNENANNERLRTARRLLHFRTRTSQRKTQTSHTGHEHKQHAHHQPPLRRARRARRLRGRRLRTEAPWRRQAPGRARPFTSHHTFTTP